MTQFFSGSDAAMSVVQGIAGGSHTCVVTDEGGVKCRGAGKSGQLGNGRQTYATRWWTPVLGLESAVRLLALGGRHTCALLSNGGVKCWGANDSGQLGNGGTMDANMPQEVIGLGGEAVAITSGWRHTCALMQDGGRDWTGRRG